MLELLSQSGFGKKLANQAIEIARRKGGLTVFAVVDALTQLSAKLKNAGERAQADERAGRLLTPCRRSPRKEAHAKGSVRFKSTTDLSSKISQFAYLVRFQHAFVAGAVGGYVPEGRLMLHTHQPREALNSGVKLQHHCITPGCTQRVRRSEDTRDAMVISDSSAVVHLAPTLPSLWRKAFGMLKALTITHPDPLLLAPVRVLPFS